VGAVQVPTLAPGDTFLHATTHMQRHAYTRLLWFYDFALLLRAEGTAIDWPAVARQAEQAGVATAAYYGLSYTEALFGPLAPPAARRALRPTPLRRWLHEGMWPRRRILSLDVDLIRELDILQNAGVKASHLPPTVFDAYASPRQIVLHLLLSGNAWPKLRHLGRRVLPSEDWLRYYGPHKVTLFRVRLLAARLIGYIHRPRA
jgi:hypothetical protein